MRFQVLQWKSCGSKDVWFSGGRREKVGRCLFCNKARNDGAKLVRQCTRSGDVVCGEARCKTRWKLAPRKVAHAQSVQERCASVVEGHPGSGRSIFPHAIPSVGFSAMLVGTGHSVRKWGHRRPGRACYAAIIGALLRDSSRREYGQSAHGLCTGAFHLLISSVPS